MPCSSGTYFICTVGDYTCIPTTQTHSQYFRKLHKFCLNPLKSGHESHHNKPIYRPSTLVSLISMMYLKAIYFTISIMHHSQAFITRSPLTSGFQSSQEVSKPSAKRMQKFLKCPLLTRDSEEQAVIRVLSMVRTRAEPVSKSMVWLAWWRSKESVIWAQDHGKRTHFQTRESLECLVTSHFTNYANYYDWEIRHLQRPLNKTTEMFLGILDWV